MNPVSLEDEKIEGEAPEDVFIFPASFAQQRLWFIDQLESHSEAYNVPIALRILGDLNVAALECSFSELVRRHEVLRTTFRAVDGQPMQVIARSREVTLPITDLRGLEPAERAQEEHRFITQEAWAPFDLARGPLMRVRLLRTDDQAHVLVINLHHTITDNWSNQVLMRELIAAYEAFVEGREPALPELPIQYADFAHWQRASFQDGAFEDQLGYWRKKLAELPVLQLPTDRLRPALQTFSGASESIEVPSRLANGLKALSQREDGTVFMTLLTAFKILLARYSNQKDIIVGSPITNRTGPETENLIGFFLNTLVLRTRLDGDPTFREALHKIRETALEAYRNQDLPFESLVEALAPKRDLSRNPLFQVMFVLLEDWPKSYSMRDLTLDRIEIEGRPAQFDLTIFLFEGPDSIRGSLLYNVDLFDAATMRRMAGHFRTLIEAVVANPDARISQLPLLDNAERNRILLEWNDTHRDYSRDVRLHELIEAQVERTPDAIAAVFEDECLTYREVNRRANQLAHRLCKLGVGPEVIVGVFAERSIEMVVGLVATLKAGGAYLPLDPSYPAERLSFMLSDAQPIIVLVQRSLAAKLPQYAGRVVFLEDDFDAESDANPASSTQPENVAYVIYTSGSTGRPKGVMNTHRGICNWLIWLQENYPLTTNDRILQKTVFTFDVSLGEFFWSLIAGSQLIVARPGLHGDSRYLINTICETGITAIHLVPSMLAALLDDQEARRCSSLRYVICAGEALPVELQERFYNVLPHAQLHNLYGPTETAVIVTYWKCERGSGDRIVPIGWPVANTQTYILDRTMQPVPIGVPGELHIGGVQVARGYLARPELTAEKFVPNPFAEGRLYKTGDLARYRPDGAIEFLGRIDHQVKLRGLRIELGEIEGTLKRHPAVRECVAIMREDKVALSSILVGYVVAKGVTAAELRQHAQKSLPDYMVPSTFVFLDELPLTASGKVDRRALPEPAPVQTGKELVSPRDALETQLVAIWEKVLRVQPIGVTDDFFELGGYSLLAMRIFSKIERMLGKRLPLATLFQAPTVEALAAAVREQGWKPSWSPLVAIQPRGSRPPFFGVHGGYGEVMFYSRAARCLGEEQPFYGLQAEGLDGCTIRHKSVEAIANYYIEEIRRVQLHGPYFLGGYCIGGIIALEMAQQLRAAGEEVALLVLFDTNNPERPVRRSAIRKRIRLALDEASGLSPSEKLQYFARRAANRVKWGVAKLEQTRYDLADLLYETRKAISEKTGDGLLPRKLPVWVNLLRARSAYKPRVYPGRIILFRTMALDGYEWASDRGWTQLAGGGLETHEIPCKHGAMVEQQHVPVVAEKLDACIQAALSSQVVS
jgi:amino acid adenylation domain-containing protein